MRPLGFQRLGVAHDNANTITNRDDLPGTTFQVVDENDEPLADIRGDRHSPKGISECKERAFLFAASETMLAACKLTWDAVTPMEIAEAKAACGAAYLQATTYPGKTIEL